MPTGPAAVGEYREALLTQPLRDHASGLKTVHFHGMPALARKAAKLSDIDLRSTDMKRVCYVGDPETQEELPPPQLS
jgi:hypothetical protein